MTATRELWDELVGRMKKIALLDQIRGILSWDQQVTLPDGGHAARAEQMALAYTLYHEQIAAPRVGELIETLEARSGELDEDQRAGLHNLAQDWRREVALPPELVERLGRLQGQGHEAWMEARKEGRFERFAPVLAEIVDVVRERAATIDATRPLYDVMLDEYEPGMTTEQLDPLLSRLKSGLVTLLDAIRGTSPMPAIGDRFEPDAQLALYRSLIASVGYDLRCGRLDLSTHPFTCALGAGDIRITTRIDPEDLMMGLSGTMHEVGHALYEQGLPRHLSGTGLDGPASMGLHESQSRFWENTVGGSLPFFVWLDRPLREHLGAGAPDPDRLYRAANRVVPGPIRVAADEVTYNLHIIVRYEIERALVDGSLAVADLRDAWNQAYRDALGVDPASDVEGVLQDIHWSGASFGYFPTYTLGNLYAAALGRRLFSERPQLWAGIERGAFAPILAWLRENVHRHGHRYDAAEIVQRAAGEGDPVEDLLTHLWERHGALHGLTRPA